MAAGLGFKTFTTGEVLTAGDVNGYLMQGINVFTNSTARAAAITSPQEGQYSFLKDTNALEYYDGAAWVGAPVGDITAVTAGTGISGGGSSGAVTITNDMATTITTNGDLLYGTGAGTYTRRGIGSTGQVLTVSGGVPTWATPASGATFVGANASAAGVAWTYTSGTRVVLPLATENYDTDNFHSTSTNNSRMTIPTGKGGKYLFNGNCFVATTPGYGFLFLYKNGSVIPDSELFGGVLMNYYNNGNMRYNGTAVVSANAGDYFELFFESDLSSGSKTLYAAFNCVYLGA